MEDEPRIRLDLIDTAEGVLAQWGWFLKVPVINMNHTDVMINCLAGKYRVYAGYRDDVQVGVAVVELIPNQPTAFIVLVHAINELENFRDLFLSRLRALGVKTLLAASKHDPAAFEGITGMKLLYGVYRMEIG